MHQGIGDKVRAVFVSGPRYSLGMGYTFQAPLAASDCAPAASLRQGRW